MKEKNIQILRIASCFMVFFLHFGQIMNFTGKLRDISYLGAYGVSLFFIISGYLAFKNFDSKKNDNIFIYYIKKFFRLAPIFYFIILINILLHSQVYMDIPIDSYGYGWWRYILFANQIIPATSDFWVNITATWTIGIFAIFYIVAPFFKKIVFNLKSSIIITIVLYFISLKLPTITPWFNGVKYLYVFFVGAICYYTIKEQKKESMIVVFCIIQLFIGELGYISLFSILLLATSGSKNNNSKIINILDKYSYAVYLIHALIIDTLYHFPLLNGGYKIVIILTGTIIMSFVVTNYIDIPLNKFSKKIIGRIEKVLGRKKNGKV